MFHDVSFPLSAGFGFSGGPQRDVDIIRLASGAEYRNSRLAGARRRYEAGAGIKSLADVKRLIAFFEARAGQLHSFRLRDPLDYKSSEGDDAAAAQDQIIAIGDGETSTFQLVKQYHDQASSYYRPITKPVAGTVLTAIDGTVVSAAVDALSGKVSFTAAPPNGAVITAGFEFDVQVRFDMTHLSLTLQTYGAGQLTSIPLIEVFDHAPA